jgi:hypothetical protein
VAPVAMTTDAAPLKKMMVLPVISVSNMDAPAPECKQTLGISKTVENSSIVL